MRQYFVYIMSSFSGTLYVGVTNDIVRRVYEHKHGTNAGFTKRYRINRLVYYEEYSDIRDAIEREKQIKGWTRAKKIALVEGVNPTFEDLSADWLIEAP
ncbi:MAG TPA: GIY-YIG nuclease family protein [Ardenticatenaceae bacterium]|jgi:putative endonuclease